MCLAVPMQVVAIDGFTATCEARGEQRRAGLILMQHEAIAVGDHVLIQSGQVTRRVSAEEAAETWALYDQIFAIEAAQKAARAGA